MTARTALILANGDLGDASRLRARLAVRPFDLILAADGGARHAGPLGLTIDILIGDMDSISESDRSELERRSIRLLGHPAEKDETDLELALLAARDEGVALAVVLGAIGGRLDMTLANLGLLQHPGLRSISIQLWIGADTAYLLTPPGGEIQADPGDRVSLLPFGGNARGVTTSGLAFPLAGETLSVGPARGVSNRVEQRAPRVELAAGALLIVHTPAGALESTAEL